VGDCVPATHAVTGAVQPGADTGAVGAAGVGRASDDSTGAARDASVGCSHGLGRVGATIEASPVSPACIGSRRSIGTVSGAIRARAVAQAGVVRHRAVRAVHGTIAASAVGGAIPAGAVAACLSAVAGGPGHAGGGWSADWDLA